MTSHITFSNGFRCIGRSEGLGMDCLKLATVDDQRTDLKSSEGMFFEFDESRVEEHEVSYAAGVDEGVWKQCVDCTIIENYVLNVGRTRHGSVYDVIDERSVELKQSNIV